MSAAPADVCAPELPGIEPAPAAPPAPALVEVVLIGHLVHRAHVYTPTHERATLELLLRQGDGALPHVLVRHEDGAAALEDLQHVAAHCPAGAHMLVRGAGLAPYTSRRHGTVLRLVRVDNYVRLDHASPLAAGGPA